MLDVNENCDLELELEMPCCSWSEAETNAIVDKYLRVGHTVDPAYDLMSVKLGFIQTIFQQ